MEAWQQYGAIGSLLFTALLVWQMDPPRRVRLWDMAMAIGVVGAAVMVLKVLIGRARPGFVLDTGAPPGDAMVRVPGLDTPVSPGSTVGGCLLVNAIKAEVAARLTAMGRPPRVLSGAAVVGRERAVELFEAAYDEHARRLAGLYGDLGLNGMKG